jgi:hypothetical protein
MSDRERMAEALRRADQRSGEAYTDLGDHRYLMLADAALLKRGVAIELRDEANPNEYDDDAFTAASLQLQSGVWAAWNAGAKPQEIADLVKDAMDDA